MREEVSMIKNISEVLKKYKQKLREHLSFLESIKSYYSLQCFDEHIYYWGQKLGIGNADCEKIAYQRHELSGISEVLELTQDEIDQYYDEAKALIATEYQKK